MTSLYRPIGNYQIRLLYLFKQENTEPTDVIDCSLHVATMRYSGQRMVLLPGKYGGFLEISYNALSYAWGSPEKTASIRCNGLAVPVTESLHGALVAIRAREATNSFLWVDALCINQEDEQEKADQVAHMLEIYQEATQVLAWLGNPTSMEDVIIATSLSAPLEAELQLARVIAGTRWLYESDWFKRIWVQQEIFAAHSLRLLCGSYEFDGQCALLSNHRDLEKQLPLRKIVPKEVPAGRTWRGQRKTRFTDIHVVDEEAEELLELFEDGDKHLHCYRVFSRKEPTDLVETLLHTWNTKATNPSDYVYGVMGISKFPKRAISLHDWFMAPNRVEFIPIDYGMDLKSIYCVISRVLFFHLGLGLLARFKVNKDSANDLPSWVIDWRLSGSIFRSRPWHDYETVRVPKDDRNLENPWHVSSPRIRLVNGKRTLRGRQLSHAVSPPAHEGFILDNRLVSLDNYMKLRLRGRVVEDYSKDVGRREIVLTMKKKKEVKWVLDIDLKVDDVLASMLAFTRKDYRHSKDDDITWALPGEQGTNASSIGGLWLLRPVTEENYKLIACLTTTPTDEMAPYESWSPHEQADTHAVPLLKVCQGAQYKYDLEYKLGETRMFIIV